MRVYKMNDRGTFSKIAEGRVFRKGEIKLREDSNGVTATLNGVSMNVNQGIQQAKKVMASNSNVKDVSVDAGSLNGRIDRSSGEGMKIDVPIDATSSQKKIVSDVANNKTTDDVKVNFVKDSNDSSALTNESRGGLVFTKEEMDKFLRTI